MALQKSIELESGIILLEAYIQIIKVCVDSSNNHIEFCISVFKDYNARINNKPEVTSLRLECRGNDYLTYFSDSVLKEIDKSLLSQSYEYLKTQSYFLGAANV